MGLRGLERQKMKIDEKGFLYVSSLALFCCVLSSVKEEEEREKSGLIFFFLVRHSMDRRQRHREKN